MEAWGTPVVPIQRSPLHCLLREGAFTSLPGTPKAGGESGRFSARGTHTIICNGFGTGRQGLNWDFSWPATVCSPSSGTGQHVRLGKDR